MKVLVTGAAGLIGSNVVKVLEEKGIDTICFDNFSHSDYRNLSQIKGDIVWGDVTDKNSLDFLPKVDAVIHEAAITDTTLVDDLKMVKVNYAGFRSIFSFCFAKRIPLIYASSAGVYGNVGQKMSEEQEPKPHNIYAYSKYLCDRFTSQQSREKKSPPMIGLRYFNVYGPGEAHKGKAASMIYQLYKQMVKDQSPRIFKFGEQKRDFIYVKDVARITVDCLNLNRSVLSNLGTGEPRSFNEIISILNNLLKKNLKTEYIDNIYKGSYQDYTEADTRVLSETLKAKSNYTLEEGVKDYLQNHLLKDASEGF